MKNKKDIGMLFPDEKIPRPDDKRIRQTIMAGQEYMERNIPENTPILGLFHEQIKYISPLLWITQFLALIVVFILAASGEPNLYTAQNILLRIAPLTTLLAVPELIKNTLYNMTELENSCKNSGSTMLLMRLIAVGCINITILSLLAIILAGTWHYSFLSLILYALVPYNCVNVISLGLIQLLKIRGRSATQALVSLSAVIVFALPMTRDITGISAFAMLSVFIGTTVLLTVQISKILKFISTGRETIWN